jgi:hypothetical protein
MVVQTDPIRESVSLQGLPSGWFWRDPAYPKPPAGLRHVVVHVLTSTLSCGYDLRPIPPESCEERCQNPPPNWSASSIRSLKKMGRSNCSAHAVPEPSTAAPCVLGTSDWPFARNAFRKSHLGQVTREKLVDVRIRIADRKRPDRRSPRLGILGSGGSPWNLVENGVVSIT